MSLKPQWKTPDGLERSWGFDKNATPPWLMVGLSETNQESAKIMELDFAMGDIVKSVNPRIADVTEDDPHLAASNGGRRAFWVKAKSPGRTQIEVRDARTNALKAILVVRVKRVRFVRISFHFVEDKTGSKTVRTPGITDDLIDKLNSVYQSQTDLKFEAWGIAEDKVNAILGDVVVNEKDARTKKLTGDALIMGKGVWREIFNKKSDRTADFNVFFVPTDDPIGTNRNDLAYIDGDNCVIEDGFVGLDISLPHIIGRMLACPVTFDLNQIQHLMFWDETIFRTDDFIPKACANIMNP